MEDVEINRYFANKKEQNLSWQGKIFRKGMTDYEMYCNLASLLRPEERLKIFQKYCEVLGSRFPERIRTDNLKFKETFLKGVPSIIQTDVYRFLPKSKSKRGGHIPNPETCAKYIIALKYLHNQNALVLELLKPAINAMTFTFKRFGVEWFNAFITKYSQEDIARLVIL
jgi:hypothetical protein